MKVLLVSTSPQVSVAVRSAVATAGVQMAEVAAPERALAILDAGERPDIVIADNDTWPTGGFALSREIKARARMGGDMPPVLLLLAREADRWLARWSQADAHVLKPADPFDLAEVVDALVSGRPVPQLPGVGAAEPVESAAVPDSHGMDDMEVAGGMTGGGP